MHGRTALSLREPAKVPTARTWADSRRRHRRPRRQARKVVVGADWPSAQDHLGRRQPLAQLSCQHTPRLCQRHASQEGGGAIDNHRQWRQREGNGV
jgi:hypothetical protein